MSSLPSALRRQLENAIIEARKGAQVGARKALEALAVHEPDPYPHMDEAHRDLRRKLRAQAKQLGDGESQTRRGAYEIKHLVEKLAYDQWHRLLFARFLLENNLLISTEHGVSVSLDDCEELAPSLGLKDAWAVAARFAARELPQIFRGDDPAGAVELPVEDRNPLIEIVTALQVEVFTAGDSLGWCYQFWQTERKEEVNAAGNKIGADELAAVTQLFTEDYMVDFLLDNTLGAWHAGKVLASKPSLAETAQTEEELRESVELPGCPWKYLRFVRSEDRNWAPAAGTFDGWPKAAKELTCLDPCMGSGHFVVAMFERLLAFRMSEEKLDESIAVVEVIRDNLFGLELDPRCTQIGAFNLALAAWRRVGHCLLPAMNLACSGLAPRAKQEEWLKLAGDNEKVRNGMERLYLSFKDAPEIGSLINPRAAEGDLLVAAFHELQPLLEKALAQETTDDTAHEMAVTAHGLAKAAEILAGQFALVATNVPYLLRRKQDDALQGFCTTNFPNGSPDLATCFVERCIQFCAEGATTAVVTPQNWLFLGTYTHLRESLLRQLQWALVTRLGTRAFETIGGEVVNVALVILNRQKPAAEQRMAGLSAAEESTPFEKNLALRAKPVQYVSQSNQLRNPDSRITLEAKSNHPLLETISQAFNGQRTGDSPRFIQHFFERSSISDGWVPFGGTVDSSREYSGNESILFWEEGRGQLAVFQAAQAANAYASGGWKQGWQAWGKIGIRVSQMGPLPVTIHVGCHFDVNTAAIVPLDPNDLPAIWSFCCSDEFNLEVRKIDQALKVTNASLAKIPFDLGYWQKVATEKYPRGLPKPFSKDPAQWLFNGHPQGSDQPLHVAVARLLGYQWPRQTGSSFPDCPALVPDGLEKLADEDGIVCLSATKGEATAAERLRVSLVQALGKFDVRALIATAGPKGSRSETLEEWLRDEFFEQHCVLFDHRPFIWHIWDGHKSGFSALVNYHKLTHANLSTLTYAHLGDWIRRQQAAVDAGEAGRDIPLQAAKQLQARLKLILEGEPPYDLFVRWKPLSKQAIGWHPDANDGVRMNIRPFSNADILRKRVKVKWDKDRGKEPAGNKNEFPWLWGWDEEKQDFTGVGKDLDGNRWNDCHYTNEIKRKAREANQAR